MLYREPEVRVYLHPSNPFCDELDWWACLKVEMIDGHRRVMERIDDECYDFDRKERELKHDGHPPMARVR